MFQIFYYKVIMLYQIYYVNILCVDMVHVFKNLFKNFCSEQILISLNIFNFFRFYKFVDISFNKSLYIIYQC